MNRSNVAVIDDGIQICSLPWQGVNNPNQVMTLTLCAKHRSQAGEILDSEPAPAGAACTVCETGDWF